MSVKNASVQLADSDAFNEEASNDIGSKYGYVTTLIVDQIAVDGWVVIGEVPDVDDHYRFILRRSLNDGAGMSEYACVLMSDDSYCMEVCQHILTQNDDDFQAGDFDRFRAFDMVLLG